MNKCNQIKIPSIAMAITNCLPGSTCINYHNEGNKTKCFI